MHIPPIHLAIRRSLHPRHRPFVVLVSGGGEPLDVSEREGEGEQAPYRYSIVSAADAEIPASHRASCFITG